MTSETPLSSPVDPLPELLETHLEPFVAFLRAAGYANRTIGKKRAVAATFARWTRERQIAPDDLNQSHVMAYVERLPHPKKARVSFELAALRLVLKYLESMLQGRVALRPIEVSPADELEQSYRSYLRDDRGLAANSLLVYLPFVHDFLIEHMCRAEGVSHLLLKASTIQNFILEHTHARSAEYSRLLTVALRSFLRFLFLRGKMERDLSGCVPMVRKWQQASIPCVLTPKQIEQVLASTDLSTPRGRRDHAILLLLARLGLRAGEIVTLELGDICWRVGELVVRTKGRVLDRLPLLSDVGEALARYIQMDRPRSESRRVFLRMIAPHQGLTGPAAVGHIVRLAFVKAQIRPTSRGAAHLFRHSLATRMIRHGASIPEIAEALRHRSQNTTSLYAKVALETLRGVARPWPVKGGVQ
jgi:site-specific recombinase XerD